MTEPSNDGAVEMTETELNDVSGALPAVQKVRDAAARMSLNARSDDGDAIGSQPQ